MTRRQRLRWPSPADPRSRTVTLQLLAAPLLWDGDRRSNDLDQIAPFRQPRRARPEGTRPGHECKRQETIDCPRILKPVDAGQRCASIAVLGREHRLRATRLQGPRLVVPIDEATTSRAKERQLG